MTDSNKTQAATLQQALEGAFDVMSCRKALVIAKGDMEAAAKWLVSGGWRAGKLVDFRGDFGAAVTEVMATTGKPYEACSETLRNCGWSVPLAVRVLKDQPLLG